MRQLSGGSFRQLNASNRSKSQSSMKDDGVIDLEKLIFGVVDNKIVWLNREKKMIRHIDFDKI